MSGTDGQIAAGPPGGYPRWVTQECRIALATDLEKVGFGFVLVGRAFGFSI